MAASKQKDLLLALELITSPELPRIARSFAAEALKMQEKAKPWAMGKGIQGIGIAEKITDGQKLGVLAIKVYVEKKLPKSKLEDVVPKNLTVPGVEEKIETDIQEIGIVAKEPNTIRVRPAIPGFGVGHVNITVGTFGCLVRKKDDDETLYILSNSHVLADEGTGTVGDRVIQPGKYDGGAAPGDVIAELSQWIPFQFTSTGYPNTVDAAIAKVKNKASVTSAIRLIGVPTGASNRVRARDAGAEDGSDDGLHPGDHPGYQLPHGAQLQETRRRVRSRRLAGSGSLHPIHRWRRQRIRRAGHEQEDRGPPFRGFPFFQYLQQDKQCPHPTRHRCCHVENLRAILEFPPEIVPICYT